MDVDTGNQGASRLTSRRHLKLHTAIWHLRGQGVFKCFDLGGVLGRLSTRQGTVEEESFLLRHHRAESRESA